MYNAQFIRRLRTLLVVMMTIAIVAEPLTAVAETIHACDTVAAVCGDGEVSQADPHRDTTQIGHDYQAHQLGDCHVHMIVGGFPGIALEPAAQTDLSCFSQAVHASLGPDGLYRPPRA